MPGTHITKTQVGLYMKLRKDGAEQVTSAAKTGISERSGRRIEKGKLQSCAGKIRGRTRPDPLKEAWETYLEPKLMESPTLLPITLLEDLQSHFPGQYPDSIHRTLQRRVKQWKALKGPEKELMFMQEHPPGLQGLSDFTHPKNINITINGKPFKHMLYHFRLIHSSWSYMKVICGGESYTALTSGLQEALWRLGGCPHEHRTDHLSAAFKNLNKKNKVSARKELTKRYDAFCKHYNMKSTHNNLGEKHENGGIESPHGHLKRRIKQALLLRKSNDFKNIEEYQEFIDEVVGQHNCRNAKNVNIERKELQALPKYKTTDFDEEVVKVSSSGTILVKRVTYTLPPRLTGERLRVHVYDDKLKCYLGSTFVYEVYRAYPKSKNSRARVINYRHLIGSLKKKPQAFRYSKFRDDLFPSEDYRLIWKYVDSHMEARSACKYIVGILAIAAENDCENSLSEYILSYLTKIGSSKLPILIDLQKKFINKKASHVAKKTVFKENKIKQHELKNYDLLLPSSNKLQSVISKISINYYKEVCYV